MIREIIQTTKPYPVLIGKGLLKEAGTILTKEFTDLSRQKLVVISDSNVMPLYGQVLMDSLKESGCLVISYEIPAGEPSKNWNLLGELLEFLAESQVTRSDCLIALGGGVVGDLTGFAASIFLRGISFIQIPTTLLAAVDSSVGGKTAVDLKAGKNLAGTFWQPKVVLCDTGTFVSLTKDAFLDGVAESIKYGILRDEQLFSDILEHGFTDHCDSIVCSCIRMKGEIVSEDEFDQGTRELLNLGHTFGHALETLSHYSISHGHAVAIGMHMAGLAAKKLGLCDKKCSNAITSALLALGFTLDYSFTNDELLTVMLKDKKRKGRTIDLILPFSIGDCRIYPMDIDKLPHVLP